MNKFFERTSISAEMIVFNTGNIIARSPAQPSVGDLIAVDDAFFFNGSASIHDRLAWEDSRIYNSAHIWNQGKVAVQQTGIS